MTSSSADPERPLARRRYDSPVRRRQATQTRERIVAAATDLVRERASWDWVGVTAAAVAQRAGVHERTIFRHFHVEGDLRTAVAEHLEGQAGVVDGVPGLRDLGAGVGELFAYLASIPGATAPDRVDPALATIDARRRESVAAAVAAAAPDLTADQQRQAAAVLDVLGGVPSFRRLVTGWQLDAETAARSARWAIDLLSSALLAGEGPQ